VDHICRCHTDTEFREAYANAGTVVCDGKPLLWLSRLLKRPLREKLSGSDLVYSLSEFAARNGLSIYLFGAEDGIAARAAQNLVSDFPNLKVAGVSSPPMGFYRNPEESAAAVQMISASAPDICFVALGSPQQEVWMWRNHQACDASVMIGVGGSLDFLAGRIRRAPRWMQELGLEWIWRLCHEPRRLWRRYLIDDMKIVGLVWREYRRLPDSRIKVV
jgi:N-acetylglucosaminyldiphosphoundecaprenol N-acetyl-beta-D-mannosaminyltransferase